MLDELENSVKDLGEIHKHDQGRREEQLLSGMGIHSEKLAIAFGLLNTTPGTEIVVMKNPRICENCHLFIKLVSKIVDRQFVVRDATRFHHFRNGTCSCKDYGEPLKANTPSLVQAFKCMKLKRECRKFLGLQVL
ncbi:hypothetical protein CJ030_MR2G004931 [Morella rubra]|uniref:DYW domain-containing protein n=1 Tax=Morella rubra TaxID=262757 RepID=A0A6A1WFC4_9ROSI|nr:hypothetical protein CJ030_MR2G004931 [Morella rubra]